MTSSCSSDARVKVTYGSSIDTAQCMELYHSPMSVCSQRVRLVLREKGLRPVEHLLNLRAGDETRPAYLALNPNGVVPTLVDRGAVIAESSIICEYLDEAYPSPPLRAHTPLDRATMRFWTSYPDLRLHEACGAISLAIAFRHQMLALPGDEMERQIDAKPDPKLRAMFRSAIALGIECPQAAEGLRIYSGALARMAKQLDGASWLAGDKYSLADAAILPYIDRLEQLAMSWMWHGLTSVERWLEHCRARANYSGIGDYLDPRYLVEMRTRGEELRADLQRMCAQVPSDCIV